MKLIIFKALNVRLIKVDLNQLFNNQNFYKKIKLHSKKKQNEQI